MNISLFDFQEDNVRKLISEIKIAKVLSSTRQVAVSFSAPTGSGKTVMMASLIERIFRGDDATTFSAESDATFLWLSDQPELNEQSANRIKDCSSLLPDQLVVIDSSFDAEVFPAGKIFFLNTQKLGKDKNLTNKEGGDGRNWTIWETIKNTVALRSDRFYLVVDEAHRGMNKTAGEEAETRTIAQKFLLGSPNEIDPVPIVIGVSATPQRFQNLVSGSSRVLLPVSIDPAVVRASGLLKDLLTVRVSKDDSPSDFSLLRAAAMRWKSISEEWAKYCQAQNVPTVRPILVVQVEDAAEGKISATNLEQAVSAIEEAVGSVSDEAFCHCFQESSDIQVGKRSIRRIDASNVQGDSDARFVFFKMALTTGWDCPRAEVMMSFRRAQDATFIAQLVGRMVRSPLARRIEGSEELNKAHLYLPHYDKKTLKQVIDHLKADPDNVPATDVKFDAELVELKINPTLAKAYVAINGKPSYASRKGRRLPNIRRLVKFSTLLTTDGIDSLAMENARTAIVNLLESKRKNLISTDDSFLQKIESHEAIVIDRLEIDQQTYETKATTPETIQVSDKNIEDIYRLSKQRISDDIAVAYLASRMAEKVEPRTAKLELHLMLQRSDVIEDIEKEAFTCITKTKASNAGAISGLASSKRARYDELWSLAKQAEPTLVELPELITLTKESDEKFIEKHIYVDENGQFAAKLNDWEIAVLDEDLENAIGFLRNVPRKPWALAYTYATQNGEELGFPDFLIVRDVDGDPVVDVVEPHRLTFSDAVGKVKGLAVFADKHGASFGRVEVAIVDNVGPRRLDLSDAEIRSKALNISSQQELENLFAANGYRRVKS